MTQWAWWNVSCNKKKAIQINTTYSVTNYLNNQFNLTYDSDMAADFSDVYILNGAENAVLDYFIENKTNSAWAWFIVNSTVSTTNGTQFYAYYNCTGTASPGSSFNRTFGPNVIGAWFMDEDTGIWVDSSGNGRTLSQTGTVVINTTTVKNRKSAYFNTTASWLNSSQFWNASLTLSAHSIAF
jgi:hypothetical protein